MTDCQPTKRGFVGTTKDAVTIMRASDCEIGFQAANPQVAAIAYLRPQEARQAALHILKLCDEIEGIDAIG